MSVMAPKTPRRGGASKDRHTTPKLQLHVPQSLWDALERFQAETRPEPSKTAIVKTALEEFLKSRGYWPPGSAQSAKGE